MLYYALVFLLIAGVAAVLGFGGIAFAAAGIELPRFGSIYSWRFFWAREFRNERTDCDSLWIFRP